MPKFNASQAECFVSVYREGALAAVGHDLKLRVTDFTIEITIEPPAIRAEFRAESLRVVGTLKNNRVNENEPAPPDKREIEENIHTEVLEVRKYPTILFYSTSVEKDGNTYRVTGWLELHGFRREMTFTAEQGSDRVVTKVLVHQPDFGITPFRAFMGMLRVKPDVFVELSVPFAVT
jgi:polyisoprenoid-binding protein YceI